MGNALFYHLTRSSAEALLPQLLPRALDQGWMVELRCLDQARAEELDAGLWKREGFLPHGVAGGTHDARQPVLLRWPDAPPAGNGARCLFALDGCEVGRDEAAALERTCILFDGNDPAALDRARIQWRDLTAAGVEAQYWSEAGGKWERKR